MDRGPPTPLLPGKEDGDVVVYATRDGTEALREAFAMFDVDQSHTLTVGELKAILTRDGSVLSDDDVAQILADGDTNGDGVLDIDEFVKLMTSRPQG